MNDSIDKIINNILDIELEMFLSVKTGKEPQCLRKCRENSNAFKLTREAAFRTWSEKTLQSYYLDLLGASLMQNNLMTIKYGRMSGQIPKLYDNKDKDAMIEEIIEIEREMSKDAKLKYPNDFKDNLELGSKYRKGELETYGNSTVKYYLNDRQNAKENNRNLTEEVLLYIKQKIGLDKKTN